MLYIQTPRILKLLAIIFVLQFVFITYMPAQQLDSLKVLLANAKEDTAKVSVLLAICKQSGTVTDLEKMEYAQRALSLAERLNDRNGMAASHYALGAASNNLGKFDKALAHLNKALPIASKSTDKRLLGSIYNSTGASHYLMGNYPQALFWLLKGLRLYEELGDTKRVADIMFNLSNLYFQMKDFKRSSEYAAKAGAVYTKLKDTIQVALVESQFGNIAYEQFWYDSALVHYKRALKITENLKDKTYGYPSLNGIGAALFETGRHDEALKYHEKTLEVAREIGDDSYISSSLMNLGREYGVVGRFPESERLLKEAIGLSKQIGAKRVTCDAYLFLAETYERKKDYKSALDYRKLCMAIKDTIFNEENTELINDLKVKYENEKKEKAIAVLNATISEKQKKQELLDAQVKKKNIIILSVVCVAILLFISGLLLYSRQRLRQKNRFQATLNEQQKGTADALIQMQENERNRIARELHDGIGTFLSTLKINLQVLESNVADEKMIPYKNNAALLDKTSEELRKITKGLSNEALQENGLAWAIRALTESVNTSGVMQLTFLSHETDERLGPLLETNLYRIAQELINNCIRHSQATKVSLQLIGHEGSVLLMLEDNGIGFDTENRSEGMGLKNIRNRVNFLNGTFKVESVLKKGSTFIAEVPKQAA